MNHKSPLYERHEFIGFHCIKCMQKHGLSDPKCPVPGIVVWNEDKTIWDIEKPDGTVEPLFRLDAV